MSKKIFPWESGVQVKAPQGSTPNPVTNRLPWADQTPPQGTFFSDSKPNQTKVWQSGSAFIYTSALLMQTGHLQR